MYTLPHRILKKFEKLDKAIDQISLKYELDLLLYLRYKSNHLMDTWTNRIGNATEAEKSPGKPKTLYFWRRR